MTEQYLPGSINGQPATLSLNATPQAADAITFGAVNTSALLFPDSQLSSGPGFTVTNDADDGTSIQFLAPGVYTVSLTIDSAALGFVNFLLGRTDTNAITAGNGYPAATFTAIPTGGVIAIGEVAAAAFGFITVTAQVTISGADVNPLPSGDPNPNAVLIIAATPATAPANTTTAFSITRIGAAG